MDQDLSKTKVTPEGMKMPHIPELVFTIILHIPVVCFTLVGIYHLVKKRSPMPLYFIIGGYICSLLEPIVDVNGMCYFPLEGQIVGTYDYGCGIPLLSSVHTAGSWGARGTCSKVSWTLVVSPSPTCGKDGS